MTPTDHPKNVRPELYKRITVAADKWLELACREAVASVLAGGGPFGAVVVQYDRESRVALRHWIGRNRVTLDCDPTAHAEMVALRAACRELGAFHLGDISDATCENKPALLPYYCVIYSSCEPCPMCYAAIRWARIPELVFAATRFDASVPGVDFADADIYDDFEHDYSSRAIKVSRGMTPLANAAFDLWRKSSNHQY